MISADRGRPSLSFRSSWPRRPVFVGLQVFVIKAFCKFCMTAHACGFAAALLCLKNIPLAADPDTPMWTTGQASGAFRARRFFLSS